MKKYLFTFLLTLSGVACSLHVSAQLTFQPVNGQAEISQVVSNIFGLNCENINTVSVQGVPNAIGIYSNGSSIGLSSGMVMATGYIFNFNSNPSSYFSSTNFNSPGDPDIDQYASGPFSFDALSVTFQFTPTVTDTVKFKYVFASEEYPEYSTSPYSDRFLFLVSENNGPAQNVAVIPGTTTTVEINNVNQFVNPQYYIENVAPNPNASNFVFDGYTTPFIAQFYVQAGQTYTIKLVIADVYDGIYDSAIFLDEQVSYSSISGDLLVAGAPAQDGTIEIFDAAEDSIVATPVYTLPVVNGNYSADSVPAGNYHVRYLPDPIANPGALPVYFTSGSTWSGATLIGLPCYLNSVNLNSTSVSVSGPGSISGTIYIDSSFQKAFAVPYENAVVLLQDLNTGEFIDFTRSTANGSYQFTNLPYGDYYVLLDVPYMPQLDTLAIHIDAAKETHNNVNHSIEPDGIHAEITSLGLSENELKFGVYPNPANDKFHLYSEDLIGSEYLIKNAGGQIVQKGVLHSDKQTIEAGDLGEGLYFISVNNAQQVKTIKLILLR